MKYIVGILVGIGAVLCRAENTAEPEVLAELERLRREHSSVETTEAGLRFVRHRLEALGKDPLVQKKEQIAGALIERSDAHVIMRLFQDHRMTYQLWLIAWEGEMVTFVEIGGNEFPGAKVSMMLWSAVGSNTRSVVFDAFESCPADADFSMSHRVFDADYLVITFNDAARGAKGTKVVFAPGFVPSEGEEALEEGFRALSKLAAYLIRAAKSGVEDPRFKDSAARS